MDVECELHETFEKFCVDSHDPDAGWYERDLIRLGFCTVNTLNVHCSASCGFTVNAHDHDSYLHVRLHQSHDCLFPSSHCSVHDVKLSPQT